MSAGDPCPRYEGATCFHRQLCYNGCVEVAFDQEHAKARLAESEKSDTVIETRPPGGAVENWVSLVDPIAKRLEIAAKMNMEFVHNPEGASATATLLRKMANALDDCVSRNAQNGCTMNLKGSSSHEH